MLRTHDAGVGESTAISNSATVSSLTADPTPANNTSTAVVSTPALDPTGDADNDGLNNGFEMRFGLKPFVSSGDDGAAGDPDQDMGAQRLWQPRGTRDPDAHGDEVVLRRGRHVLQLQSLLPDSESEHAGGAGARHLPPAVGSSAGQDYVVNPQSRFNIWVDNEGLTDPRLAALANAELSAVIESTNGVPIIAERAMYVDQPGRAFGAGHESAGVTAPATQWFLAEGATGDYFDEFILIANPQTSPAAVRADFLLSSGLVTTKNYTVAGNTRFNIWVDLEDPRLADAAVSTRVTSTNDVPIIVERAMWWPGPTADTWQEAHNSPGEVTTGTRRAIAEGEVGGPRSTETYVLIANTSSFDGMARVTVLFEDGTLAVARDFQLKANSRSNVAAAVDFPETVGKRFGVLIESIGETPAQIVVERAMYSDADGVHWAAGTNALATKLP